MLIRQLFDPETASYTYLLADPDRREAILIDPVLEQLERDLQLLSELDLTLIYVLDTHLHADHITASGALRQQTGALTALSAEAEVDCVDHPLKHGDRISLGGYLIEVRATPGHTSSCLTFVTEAQGQTFAFTGDALLIRGCGRTDFQQGDAAALYRSVHEQIFSLPPETVIYPGHDYRGLRSSTVAEELAHNPRLRADIDQARFLQIMSELQLAYPERLHEALPANRSCGLSSLETDAADTFRELAPRELQGLDGGRIVDVRETEELSGPLGALPEAVHAPLSLLKSYAQGWDRAEPILVVCRTGRRSATGCALLQELGFQQVSSLQGGMLALRESQEVTSC